MEKEKLVHDKAEKGDMDDSTYEKIPGEGARFKAMDRLSKKKRSRNQYSVSKTKKTNTNYGPKKFEILDEEGSVGNDPYCTIDEKDVDFEGYSSLDKVNEYCTIATNKSVIRKGELNQYSTAELGIKPSSKESRDSSGYDHIAKPGGTFIVVRPREATDNIKDNPDREVDKGDKGENVYDTLDEVDGENPYDVAADVCGKTLNGAHSVKVHDAHTSSLDIEHSDTEYELIPDDSVESVDKLTEGGDSGTKRPKVIVKENSLYGKSESKKGPKVTVVENSLYESNQSTQKGPRRPKVIVRENSLYAKGVETDGPKVFVEENDLYDHSHSPEEKESGPKKVIVKENSLYAKSTDKNGSNVRVVENDLYVSSSETESTKVNEMKPLKVIVKENSLYGKGPDRNSSKVIVAENDLYDSSQAAQKPETSEKKLPNENRKPKVIIQENSLYAKSGDEHTHKVMVVENHLYESSQPLKGPSPSIIVKENSLDTRL